MDESWTYEQVLKEIGDVAAQKALIAELLRRPNSRVYIDAMNVLDTEGLFFEKEFFFVSFLLFFFFV